jgi:hypothetical protein
LARMAIALLLLAILGGCASTHHRISSDVPPIAVAVERIHRAIVPTRKCGADDYVEIESEVSRETTDLGFLNLRFSRKIDCQTSSQEAKPQPKPTPKPKQHTPGPKLGVPTRDTSTLKAEDDDVFLGM